MTSVQPGFITAPFGLLCDGLSIAEIATQVETPFYLYSAATITGRLAALQDALAGVPHAVHYALKANSTLALVQLVRAGGACADANSVGEIEVALEAGFRPDEIVFTGVGKTRAELSRAVALGLRAINAESAGELDRIADLAEAQGRTARVALRVNPDIDAQTHAHISTGLRRNKFGVPLGDAADIIRTRVGRRGLHFVGVHAHIGSQLVNVEPLRQAAATLASLARELRHAGIELEHIDVGGGLGIAYDGGPEPSLAAYAAAIVEATRGTGTSLVFEPGRWLMAPAGMLVARVIDTKPAPDGRRFVVLDGGMTELLRPALYGAYHRIALVTPRAGASLVPCDVVGPVCETSDTLGLDRLLPDPQVDDVVAVYDTGAYGSVMASNYNRRPLPAEVLVEGAAWRLIRTRQTIHDQMARER